MRLLSGLFKKLEEFGPKLYKEKLTPSVLQNYLVGAIMLRGDVQHLEILGFPDGSYVHRFQKDGVVYNLTCPTKDFFDDLNPALFQFSHVMEHMKKHVSSGEVSMGVISQVNGARNHFASFCARFYLETKLAVGTYPLDSFIKQCRKAGYSGTKVINIGQQSVLDDVECGWHTISNMLQMFNIPEAKFTEEKIILACKDAQVTNTEINPVSSYIGQAMLPGNEMHKDFLEVRALGEGCVSYKLKFDQGHFIREVLLNQLHKKINEANVNSAPFRDWENIETNSTESASDRSELDNDWLDASEESSGSLRCSTGAFVQQVVHLEVESISKDAIAELLKSQAVFQKLDEIGVKGKLRAELEEVIRFYQKMPAENLSRPNDGDGKSLQNNHSVQDDNSVQNDNNATVPLSRR